MGVLGHGWVGWRNESIKRPVELLFKFTSVRNVSAVHIHTNNYFTKNVQVGAVDKILNIIQYVMSRSEKSMEMFKNQLQFRCIGLILNIQYNMISNALSKSCNKI